MSVHNGDLRRGNKVYSEVAFLVMTPVLIFRPTSVLVKMSCTDHKLSLFGRAVDIQTVWLRKIEKPV